MAGEYKSECGCVIHVIQWTSKHRVITQKSCPLHKHAKELLEACKAMIYDIDNSKIPMTKARLLGQVAIAKAEGKVAA